MSWFSFFRRRPSPAPQPEPVQIQSNTSGDVRRHFYNEREFQTYATFFAHWDGWITAGHCMTDVNDILPPFAGGDLISWPDGLDGAVIGCKLPPSPPLAPIRGQAVIIQGFPAGSRHLETRRASVYYERTPGTWIAHITEPDEPVVTGMSGGAVVDAASGAALGIVITRNSPADLNNDRDPDESCDFVSLAALWEAVQASRNTS